MKNNFTPVTNAIAVTKQYKWLLIKYLQNY